MAEALRRHLALPDVEHHRTAGYVNERGLLLGEVQSCIAQQIGVGPKALRVIARLLDGGEKRHTLVRRAEVVAKGEDGGDLPITEDTSAGPGRLQSPRFEALLELPQACESIMTRVSKRFVAPFAALVRRAGGFSLRGALDPVDPAPTGRPPRHREGGKELADRGVVAGVDDEQVLVVCRFCEHRAAQLIAKLEPHQKPELSLALEQAAMPAHEPVDSLVKEAGKIVDVGEKGGLA